MSRSELSSDAQWDLIGELLPGATGRKGRPFADVRTMVEGIVYCYRPGIAWWDLPAVAWLHRTSGNGILDQALALLMVMAHTVATVDWSSSVDSAIARAHQHATNVTRHTGLPRAARIGTRPSRLTME